VRTCSLPDTPSAPTHRREEAESVKRDLPEPCMTTYLENKSNPRTPSPPSVEHGASAIGSHRSSTDAVSQGACDTAIFVIAATRVSKSMDTAFRSGITPRIRCKNSCEKTQAIDQAESRPDRRWWPRSGSKTGAHAFCWRNGGPGSRQPGNRTCLLMISTPSTCIHVPRIPLFGRTICTHVTDKQISSK
jgi:hypothetical protein